MDGELTDLANLGINYNNKVPIPKNNMVSRQRSKMGVWGCRLFF